jgi:hypothetical protein
MFCLLITLLFAERKSKAEAGIRVLRIGGNGFTVTA